MSITRVVIPDSHGQYIDKRARSACIQIIKDVKPNEVVWLGDHLDASGLFSNFKRQYLTDDYDFAIDVREARSFLDDVSAEAPRAKHVILEGNHEQHVERWIASVATSDTADFLDGAMNPRELFAIDKRRWRYIKRSDYTGLSVRGAVQLEGCVFMHGAYQSLHATHRHAEAFGVNICHGHTHRAASVTRRRPTGEVYGGYCPGTLAQLAPLYQQTTPEQWTHGVGLQIVHKGILNHYNVSVVNGKYRLP